MKKEIIFEDGSSVFVVENAHSPNEIDNQTVEAIKKIIKIFPGTKPTSSISELQ